LPIIFSISEIGGTIILLNAEFNAQFSQARVADGILNAVQSDRLAFMLERTKNSGIIKKCKQLNISRY
jgi:hypothetical protein